MIAKKMQKAINEQINAELYSAYLYLSMEAYFQSENLQGFANWMRCQAQEEVVHAMKFFGFVHDRGGRVTLKAIDGPETSWDSPLAAFKAAYAHEQKVTSLINSLVKIAREEGDTASEVLLQWYVTEQVEEEASADQVIQKLKLMADAPGGLFLLDQQLGQRAFTPPPAGGAK
ncbi:MAG TPA: ferritin [Phycisphaerae bacterium]|nr:ferritin [Phycisphaerae bacterium]